MTVFAAFSRSLRREDRGQDLAEYCLLTALIALVAVGIFIHFSGGVQALWNSANTTLVAGNSTSASGATTASTGSTAPPATGTATTSAPAGN
jgi:Flp pilus assembly pilin Flp